MADRAYTRPAIDATAERGRAGSDFDRADEHVLARGEA
jgi:hypothetical protein